MTFKVTCKFLNVLKNHLAFSYAALGKFLILRARGNESSLIPPWVSDDVINFIEVSCKSGHSHQIKLNADGIALCLVAKYLVLRLSPTQIHCLTV